MPKRRTDDIEPESRTDSGMEIKSRSGRLVKPRVYNDGTVALVDGKDEQFLQSGADDLRTGYARFDDEDDEDLSDVSEGSYGSRTRSARGTHLGRMDNSRPSRRTATRPPRAPSTHATGYGGGGVFKQAAVEILRSERRLMSTGEIARLALRRGLVRCTGKTPEATMASALYTDIKRKEGHSLFVRPREGLFGLREWVDEGVIQISPPQQTTNLNVPLPPQSSHHVHLQHHHHSAPAAAMDSDNGTGTVHNHRHFLDGEQQQPGTSQDSGDRLMELLCAAEEINREVPPLSENGQEEELLLDQDKEEKVVGGVEQQNEMEVKAEEEEQEEEHVDVEAATVLHAANHHHQQQQPAIAIEERHASTTLPEATLKAAPHAGASAASAATDALKAAQLFAQQLERTLGTSHPEVGLGYLHVANLYMAASNMPIEMKNGAEIALQKVHEALKASSSIGKLNTLGSSVGNIATTTALPGTATKAKQQGFLVPAAPGPVKLGVNNNNINNPERTPAGPAGYGNGPVAAPTPLALEEARGWNGGPFAVNTGPLPTSAVPPASVIAPAAAVTDRVVAAVAAPGAGVASDTENDADVEMCIAPTAASGKVNAGQRLPLHTVPAPLTAT